MQDALQMVREELGENAVIFQTREVRPKGIFGPRHIEVSAARESGEDETEAARPTLSAHLSQRLQLSFSARWERSQRPLASVIHRR